METVHESVAQRVLVTGAHGFTGRHVVTELERAKYQVYELGQTRPGLQAGAEERVDLLDAQAVADAVAAIRPHAAIHLAAVAFAMDDDVDAIYRTNVVGTRNLLAALAALPELPAVVVLASSANVYGGTARTDAAVFNEQSPARPQNDYAVSKLAMEHMARLWIDRLPLVVTRPFNYTGVGQEPRFLVPKIVEHFRSRAASIELGNLDVWRSFSDVRAVAWSYRRLLECVPVGETFNICPGRVCSVREIVSAMESIAGYPIDVRVNPAFVRKDETKRLEGDDSKLRRLIGASHTYALADTLRWMYEA